MKKLTTVLLVLIAACHRGGATGSGTGANSPEGAVNAFLAAAKAQDLQALGAVWGTSRGSVRNNAWSREELEQRQLIIIRLLCQDSARILGKTQGLASKQIVRVELKRAASSLEVNFTTVEGPSSRWYVENFENERLTDLCRA